MRALLIATLLAILALRPTPPAAGASLFGDLDGDCAVSIQDISIVASHFGYARGSLNYVAAYDFDGDGRISIMDIQRVAAHFGERC